MRKEKGESFRGRLLFVPDVFLAETFVPGIFGFAVVVENHLAVQRSGEQFGLFVDVECLKARNLICFLVHNRNV